MFKFTTKRKLRKEIQLLRAENEALKAKIKDLLPERGKAGRFVKRNINQQ